MLSIGVFAIRYIDLSVHTHHSILVIENVFFLVYTGCGSQIQGLTSFLWDLKFRQ